MITISFEFNDVFASVNGCLPIEGRVLLSVLTVWGLLGRPIHEGWQWVDIGWILLMERLGLLHSCFKFRALTLAEWDLWIPIWLWTWTYFFYEIFRYETFHFVKSRLWWEVLELLFLKLSFHMIIQDEDRARVSLLIYERSYCLGFWYFVKSYLSK